MSQPLFMLSQHWAEFSAYSRSPLMHESLQFALSAAIMTVSLYHFADKHSKTADGYP